MKKKKFIFAPPPIRLNSFKPISQISKEGHFSSHCHLGDLSIAQRNCNNKIPSHVFFFSLSIHETVQTALY